MQTCTGTSKQHTMHAHAYQTHLLATRQIFVVPGLEVQLLDGLVAVHVGLVAGWVLSNGHHLGPIGEGLLQDGALPLAALLALVHVQRYQILGRQWLARDGIAAGFEEVGDDNGRVEDDSRGCGDGIGVGIQTESANVEGEGTGVARRGGGRGVRAGAEGLVRARFPGRQVLLLLLTFHHRIVRYWVLAFLF